MDTSKHRLDKFRAQPNKPIWYNWSLYIAMQEGGLSKWKGDTAASKLPPLPHWDGQFYHTNRGWTWPTWVNIRKRAGLSTTPAAFYRMTLVESSELMKFYFKDFQFSPHANLNLFCFYIAWGGGWYDRFNSYFKKVFHGIDCKVAMKTYNPQLVFKAMVKARKLDLQKIARTSYADYPNIEFEWLGATEIFYREFSKVKSNSTGSGLMIPLLIGAAAAAFMYMRRKRQLTQTAERPAA